MEREEHIIKDIVQDADETAFVCKADLYETRLNMNKLKFLLFG